MKANILHIIDSFEQGGTERQALQLVRMLHTQGGHEVHLACLQKKGTLLGEAEKLGLGEIAEYPLTSFYDLNFVRQVRSLVRFLRQNEISLIHTHDFYTNVFGMTAGTIARVPARIASKRETDGFRTAAQKRTERAVFRFAHQVIANSNDVRDQLIREGALAERIVTLHNGLDMTRFTPSAGVSRELTLKSFGLPQDPDRRFVVIVANVNHPVKDHETFLRAAARVHAEAPASAFVVAGEGKLMSSLQEFAAQMGLARDVFFLGRCERVADLLSISDVCVLSSRAEGFSNSILEYMAAARPVVVTDVGGVREAVVEGETGYIVSVGDDEEMGDRITQLLRDPKRARAMGERGRSVVTEKFSCAAQLARIEQLYAGVAQLRSASRWKTENVIAHTVAPGRDACPSADGPRGQSEQLEGVRQ